MFGDVFRKHYTSNSIGNNYAFRWIFVYQQKLNFYILVFWGVFGTILGSMPWYYLGKLVNEKRLSNFLDKRGKYIGITSNDLIKSRRWFDKYGVSLVFWGRLVPGIRTLISVPA